MLAPLPSPQFPTVISARVLATLAEAEEALDPCFMEEVAEVPSVHTCLSLRQSSDLHTGLLKPRQTGIRSLGAFGEMTRHLRVRGRCDCRVGASAEAVPKAWPVPSEARGV